MSEKEPTESVEEVQQETAEEVQEQEASPQEGPEEEQIEAPDEVVEETVSEVLVEKKGLMERRPNYSQSSVPNAHRGYSGTPPIIMLLIISVFVLLSIIFATSAVIN